MGVSERANELVSSSLVWDNHGCITLKPGETAILPELARYRSGGVDVALLNVGFDITTIEDNFRMLAMLRHWIAAHPETYRLIESVDDIDDARATGRLGVGFNLEGTVALGDQPSMISLYYDLGVRWMSMAYNKNNSVGGGCQDDDTGLTDFGREVLDEMARVGMVACVSHTGYTTVRDVLGYTSNPVIFLHSNPLALVDHARNVPDELMKACADTGGVMGISGVGIFLGDNDASPERIARHIDHAVGVMGVDHVGIGFDYVFDQEELDDYVRSNPQLYPPEEGYERGIHIAGPEAVRPLVESLLSMGYPDDDVKKVMGGNFLRVAREVWQVPRITITPSQESQYSRCHPSH